MNVFLLGSTGRVGTIILENLILKGYQVQILIRDRDRLKVDSHLIKVIVGDVLNNEDVATAMEGSNLVISALNTGGINTLTNATPIIIKQMKKNHLKRIITIGTAGILQSRIEPNKYRFQSRESKRKTTKDAEDHLNSYFQLKESLLDWTIVCPTYLPIGERMGTYRCEKNFLPDNPSSISIYDTADFAVKQIDEKEFIGYRVGLTY